MGRERCDDQNHPLDNETRVAGCPKRRPSEGILLSGLFYGRDLSGANDQNGHEKTRLGMGGWLGT